MSPTYRPTRRQTLVSLAAAPLAYFFGSRVAFARDARPNIVFIMADDLGYADVSCYGRHVAEHTIVIFTSDNGGERFADLAGRCCVSETLTGS